MARPATDDERNKRRTQVATLMLGHKTQAQMGALLGVSRVTINSDVAAIRAEWKAERIEAYDRYVAEDLIRLAHLESALWPAATAGKWLATDRCLAIIAQRTHLLATAAPARHEVRIEHTTAADAELERLAEQLASRALEESAMADRGPA